MQASSNFVKQLEKGTEIFSHIENIKYKYNPRELVYQSAGVKLYHYSPHKKKPKTIPTLIVFATVNRPEILDLMPEKSFIGRLLKNEMDIYLLEWDLPAIDQVNSFENYIASYLHSCVLFIKEQAKKSKINLIGICQGGVMALCYALLYQNINKLVLISTPIDFQTKDNTIYHFVKNLHLDDFLRLKKNIPGKWLTEFFILLKPFELIGRKYLRFLDNLSDKEWVEKFLLIEKWLHDAPDQAGTAFAEFLNNFYQQNKLIKGKIFLQEKQIDLRNLKIPVLNVIGLKDDIIPPGASLALRHFVDAKFYTQKTLRSGHIGLYISDRSKNLPRSIALWLKT